MRPAAIGVSFSVLFGCGNIDATSQSADDASEQTMDAVRIVPTNQLNLSSDPATIIEARIIDQSLHLTVQYGGGARDHSFELFCAQALAKSLPPKASLYLSHNAHGDLAKAMITKELVFDLSALEQLSQGTISLRLFPPGERRPLPLQEQLLFSPK